MKIDLPYNLSFIQQHFSNHHKYLVKLGGFKDGAYVANYFSLMESKILICGGVGSNVRFESDFFDINQQVNIVLVDPTVSVVRMIARGFYHFIKKGQSGYRSLSEVLNYLFLIRQGKLIKKYLGNLFTINDILFKVNRQLDDRSIFIKLDIEGAEYDLLQNIIDLKKKITGVSIEFHDLHDFKNIEKLKKFLDELEFSIVHISVNEVCLTNGNYPSVLEISLAPNDQLCPSSEEEKYYEEMYLQASNTLDHELVYLKR